MGGPPSRSIPQSARIPTPIPASFLPALVLCFAASVLDPLRAAQIQWADAADGAWSAAANWSPPTVPGPGDDILITLAGTYTVFLDVDATVASLTVGGTSGTQTLALASNRVLTLNGPGTIGTHGAVTLASGVITGAGDLTIDGALSWSGGEMEGPGATHANGGVALTGSLAKILDGRALTTAGTVTWTGTGALQVNGLSSVLNDGTWEVQNDAAIIVSGPATFTNTGTLRKSGGTGTSTIQIPYDNQGVFDVQAGTLSMALGGVSSGSMTAQPGALLRFEGGTNDLGTSSSLGADVISITGGSVNVAGTWNVTTQTSILGGTVSFLPSSTPVSLGTSLVVWGSITLNSGETVALQTLSLSGTLAGSDLVTVSGLTTWNGGTMTGPGTTQANGGMAIGGSLKVLSGRTLTTGGTVTLTGTGALQVNDGSTVTNVGTWELQSNAPIYDLGTSGTFTNQGVVRKTAGNISSIQLPYDNQGSIEVQSGTISLSDGGVSSGSMTAAAGASLTFAGGTHDLQASSSLTAALVSFMSGAVNVSGTFDVTTQTSIQGGTVSFLPSSTPVSLGTSLVVSGSITLNSGETVALQTLDLSGTLAGSDLVTVSGLTTWDSATMTGPGTTQSNGGMEIGGNVVSVLNGARTLTTGGTVTWTGTGSIRIEAGSTITNNGTWDAQTDAGFSRSGSGSFTNQGTYRKSVATGTSPYSVPFVSTGAIEALSGTLHFTSTFTQAAGSTLLDGGALSTTTTLDFQGGVLRGSGTLTGAVTSGAEVGPGFSAGALTVAGTYTQNAAGVYFVEIGGTAPVTEHDQLSVTGTGSAALGGTLRVRLIDGLAPSLGDSFTIATYATRSGTFSPLDLQGPGCGLDWDLDYGATALTLSVVASGAPCCPDGDDDGSAACFAGCVLDSGDVCGDCDDADPTVRPGAPEICDGLDNDCDGPIDEGLQAQAETCNALDDNCDGLVDEGDPGGGATCATGLDGVCADGTEHCAAGSVACLVETGRGPEICNGEDDDCDGATDEVSDSDGDGFTDCLDVCPDAFDPGQEDLDGDGIGDACDCAPADEANPTPPEVGSLTSVHAGGATTISWSPAPGATHYNVYRGWRSRGDAWAYNHECLASRTAAPSAIDPVDPGQSTLFYHLVSSVCGEEESVLGRDHLGAPAPNDRPCPNPVFDLDGDGFEDPDDNCPAFRNPSQADFDADGLGDVCDP